MKNKPVKCGDQCIHSTDTIVTSIIVGCRKAKTLKQLVKTSANRVQNGEMATGSIG